MPCSAAYFLRPLLIWLIISGTCVGQVMPLQPIPDRMQYAREVEQKALAARDSLGLAEAWYLVGEAYEFLGNSWQAEHYFLQTLRIVKPRPLSARLVEVYVRLGEVEQRQGHFRESLSYATQALRIAQQLRSPRSLLIAYQMLGHIRDFMWNGGPSRAGRDSVLFCFNQAARLSIQLKDTLMMARSAAFLGTFFSRSNSPRAVSYFRRALDLATRVGNTEWEVKSMIHLATIYLVNNQLELAKQTLDRAMSAYNRAPAKEYGIQAMFDSRYLTYYEKKGQWEQAHHYLAHLTKLEMDQVMADRDGVIARLNIEYETNQKETQLQAQTNELTALRFQRRFTVVTVLLLLGTLGASITFFRLYRKNQRTSRRNEELVKEQNHRVKNNLQVISSLLSLQSKRLTDDIAKKAIDESRLRVQSMAILHQHLYEGDQLTAIDLSDFIPELVSGVLQAYGYPTLQPTFDIDPITLPADRAVPLGLIINELTTNACKYAFPEIKNGQPDYIITCKWTKQQIRLTVADNGPGLDPPDEGANKVGWPNEAGQKSVTSTVSRSFGMQLIQAQAEQLRGTYQFCLGEAGTGRATTFVLTINA